MNRSDDPHLRRMPGSAILAVVFLGLHTLWTLYLGTALLAPAAPLAVLFLANAAFSTTLAVGVGNRRRWSRTAGLAWCAVSIAFALVQAPMGADPAAYGASFGSAALLLYFLMHRNTRAWCDAGRSGAGFLSLDRIAGRSKAFAIGDRVELLEHVPEAGLRARTPGTVVDLREGPHAVVTEFIDPENGEFVRAVLRPDQIGRVAAGR